jgi:DNA-binding GntR family transcriptional regulator
MTNRTQQARGEAFAPARRMRLAEDVVDQVRAAILDGQFSAGQRLREDELASVLQVSRGPVREALASLEREGLVVVAPHRGASVVQLTPDDLADVYSLRTGLEVVATQLAIMRGTEEDFRQADRVLKELARLLKGRPSEQDAARLDLEFHDVLYSAARNERLRASWLGVRSQVYLFLLKRNIASPDWRDGSVSGHSEILEAVRARDEARAVQLISGHISYAYTLISNNLANAADDPLTLIAPRLQVRT